MNVPKGAYRLSVLFLAAASFAAADAAPEWIRRGRAADSTYKYYVGRSSQAASEQLGFNEATREAYEQAIRENFGFQTRIQSDAYESSKEVISTKRVQVLSQDIRVHGFEQVDAHVTSKSGKYDVWLLYRYPLAEISAEKSRLATSRSAPEQEFSEQGSAAAARKNGILEVRTQPEGASIFVDGESYGITPMRLNGVIASGRHRIRIDHPGYQTVEEDAVLVPGKKLTVEKQLVPALAKLAITSEPSNANVVINGQQVGTTPIASIEAPANKPLKIEISHAETDPLSTEIELSKDEFNSKNFELPLKDATLIVRSTPPGAEVTIDGEAVGRTPTAPKKLRAGKHEVTLNKAGYEENRAEIVLRGGEKRNEIRSLSQRKSGARVPAWAVPDRTAD